MPVRNIFHAIIDNACQVNHISKRLFRNIRRLTNRYKQKANKNGRY